MPVAQPRQLDGALLAARYAYMPNKLKYCGGDDNSELFAYAANRQSDNGLKELLAEFATMYPYLRLIADASRIADPFDYQVVEAYWLGNDLLKNVSLRGFYRYMADRQQLKKQLKPALAEKVFGKLNLGAKPHHSWHVLNIPKRTGYYPVEHTLATMDECRISWGRVKTGNLADQIAEKIIVDYRPLEFIDNKFILGESRDREVWLTADNQSFAPNLKAGDYVSIHWGWVCDILSEQQKNNLEKWTVHNLNLASL